MPLQDAKLLVEILDLYQLVHWEPALVLAASDRFVAAKSFAAVIKLCALVPDLPWPYDAMVRAMAQAKDWVSAELLVRSASERTSSKQTDSGSGNSKEAPIDATLATVLVHEAIALRELKRVRPFCLGVSMRLCSPARALRRELRQCECSQCPRGSVSLTRPLVHLFARRIAWCTRSGSSTRSQTSVRLRTALERSGGVRLQPVMASLASHSHSTMSPTCPESMYSRDGLLRLIAKRKWVLARTFVGNDASLQRILFDHAAAAGEVALAHDLAACLGVTDYAPPANGVMQDAAAATGTGKRDDSTQYFELPLAPDAVAFCSTEAHVRAADAFFFGRASDGDGDGDGGEAEGDEEDKREANGAGTNDSSKDSESWRHLQTCASNCVVGLDVEWRPASSSQLTSGRSVASVLQIATATRVFVVDLLRLHVRHVWRWRR